jgi:hypothetical protein
VSHVIATRADDGAIRLTIYDHEIIAVTLTPRRALLLGVDLVRLAAEGELMIESRVRRPSQR